MPSSSKKYSRSRRSRRRRLLPKLAIGLVISLGIGALILAWLVQSPLESAKSTAVLKNSTWQQRQADAINTRALVDLPADDGHHNNITEWWYYDGHLQTGDGRAFAFHYVVFLRQTLTTGTLFHASLFDLANKQKYQGQKRAIGNPSSGVQDAFEFAYQGWSMAGSGGDDRLRFSIGPTELELTLRDPRGPVFHDDTGLLDFGGGSWSYYYSRTRMQAEGHVRIDGERHPVTGDVWFDHQWGDFEATQMGWNWFALQLEDGRDVMIYEIFKPDGTPYLDAGTIFDGQTSVNLDADDFTSVYNETWTSPKTGTAYPVGWTLTIPEHGIEVKVVPKHRGSEFDSRVTTYNTYWEGPMRVSGSHAGNGFLELGGYDRIPLAEVVNTR